MTGLKQAIQVLNCCQCVNYSSKKIYGCKMALNLAQQYDVARLAVT
jgi:hypothetical protein